MQFIITSRLPVHAVDKLTDFMREVFG